MQRALAILSLVLASSASQVYGDWPVLSDPAAVDMSAERLDRINEWMVRSIANKDFAGGVTLVARGQSSTSGLAWLAL